MSLGQRLIKNPMEAGSSKNSAKNGAGRFNGDLHDRLDNYEDTIRRLKLLSKSQTALLKAYLYGKLMEGEKLVNKTIEYISHKNANGSDDKLQELQSDLQHLRLKDIEVDVRSTQVLLHDELAQLRSAVDKGGLTSPTGVDASYGISNGAPLPNTGGLGAIAAAAAAASTAPASSGTSDAEVQQLKSTIERLESEKKAIKEGSDREIDMLRKQLKEAQEHLKDVNESHSAAANASSSETQKKIAELTQKLAASAATVTEKEQALSAQQSDLEQANAKLSSAEKRVKELEDAVAEAKSAATAESQRAAASTQDLEKKMKEREEELLKEKADAVQEVENRMETEKDEMMEAMAQEIEELETTKAQEYDALKAEKDAVQQQLDTISSTKKEMTSRIVKLARANRELVQNYKSHKEQSRRDLQEMGQAIRSLMGDTLISKLSKVNETIQTAVRKYRREMAERKRLHNLVQELKGNIRVYMRCRPPTPKELDQFGTDAQCVSFPDDGQVKVFNEKNREKVWEFDEVFGTDSTQEQIYEDVSALVTSVMDGYNVCIFAYGQTGSGKTFTMSGPPDNRGVNTRALEELFKKSEERSGDWVDTISVSLLEVYNEEIHDLLMDPKRAKEEKLEVKMSSEHGNYVPNLIHRAVNNIEAVMNLIATADRHRSSATTNMNEHSSRSHMILTAVVESEYKPTGVKTRGKLNLVDLAGSERINKSGAAGQALKEAQNINKSLSALGDVIQARAQKQAHVPFRNSTLTFLLQDSISQDSKTLMIVCVSPVLYNSEETFCSLNFASRVRTVELGKATKNAIGKASPSPLPPTGRKPSIAR